MTLFDEVTSALDPERNGDVLLVMEWLAKAGMKMLRVTHEINFARNVADVTVFMHMGTIWEMGPSEQIVTAPKTPELADVISAGVT